MQFSLSDVKLKDNVDTLYSRRESFVHNMLKIPVSCCIFYLDLEIKYFTFMKNM